MSKVVVLALLQLVLSAAARVITNSGIAVKYESGLSQTLHHDLHWLDVTEWIQFQVATWHGSSLPGWTVTAHLSASRRGGLRSATTSNLVIPCSRLLTYGTRAFSVAGPVCWNALPDYLKSSDLLLNYFKHQLKTFLFCIYWHRS